MKNLTKHTMIAAAALVVAAGAAQAQQLKAEIPFSFRASGTLMPAGEYRVEGIRSQNTMIFKLINVDTNRAVLAVSNAGNNPALTSEDFPLPDGPTRPSSGAPTARATSSAISRSRPKK